MCGLVLLHASTGSTMTLQADRNVHTRAITMTPSRGPRENIRRIMETEVDSRERDDQARMQQGETSYDRRNQTEACSKRKEQAGMVTGKRAPPGKQIDWKG